MAATPAPRVTQGFSSTRAQQWILVAAILTGVIYGFRRVVEPASGSSSPSSGKLARLAGAGAPPDLEHWAVSYGAAFLMLSVLSLGAPELAASIAAMAVAGNLLANGTTIAADLAGLEGTPLTTTAQSSPAPRSGTPSAAQVNQATGATP